MKRYWRRSLGVAVSILIAVSIFVLGRTGFDLHAALVLKQTRIAELHSQSLSRQDLQTLGHLRSSVLEPEAGLLIVRDDEAVPRVKKIVQEIVQQHRAELHSISLATDFSNTKLPMVRGMLRLIVNEDDLGPLVRAFEGASPTIFLEQVRVSSRSSSGEEAGSAMLDLSCSISVYKDDPWPEERLP